MKAIKIFTTVAFAAMAISFAACSSKKTTEETAYNPTSELPMVEETTETPEQPVYLGASSSGLGL